MQPTILIDEKDEAEKPLFDPERIKKFKNAREALLDVLLPRGTIDVDTSMTIRNSVNIELSKRAKRK